MRTSSLAEQHRSVLDNHHPNTDDWLVVVHMLSADSTGR
jgi:hypothetical protein